MAVSLHSHHDQNINCTELTALCCGAAAAGCSCANGSSSLKIETGAGPSPHGHQQ